MAGVILLLWWLCTKEPDLSGTYKLEICVKTGDYGKADEHRKVASNTIIGIYLPCIEYKTVNVIEGTEELYGSPLELEEKCAKYSGRPAYYQQGGVVGPYFVGCIK